MPLIGANKATRVAQVVFRGRWATRFGLFGKSPGSQRHKRIDGDAIILLPCASRSSSISFGARRRTAEISRVCQFPLALSAGFE